MKKLIVLCCSILAITSFSYAQEGDFKANGGLAYGSEAGFDGGGIGINVGLEYFFTNEISAAPSFTYFFKDSEGPFSAQFNSINIDGRYYFLNEEFMVYGLVGIGILSYTIESPTFTIFGPQNQTTEFSDSETGLNIGGGIVYPLTDNIGLNGQLKYMTPGDGQLVINAGVSIGF